MSEVGAAAGDGVVGPTSERRNDGRWTAKGYDDTATATTEVGSPPDFFPSSNHYLRFPSNLQNCCMKIVWVFLLFNAILFPLVGESLFHGCGNLCFVDC